MQQETAYREVPRVEAQESEWLLYFWMISRRLPLIIFVVLLVMVAAGSYIFLTPRLYQANSLVRLRKPAPIMISPQPNQLAQQNETMDLKTATQLVMTYLTAQEALRLLQDERSPVRVRREVREYLKILSPQEVLQYVSASGIEPDLVRISVRHHLPEVAAALANGMAEAFVRRLNQEARAEASNERQFIESQLKQMEAELQRLDRSIAQVYRQLGSIDISEETKALIESARNYTLELLTVEAELQSVNHAIARLQKSLAREGPVVSVEVLKEDPVVTELQRQIASAEVERATLSTRYLPNHPAIKKLDERIAMLRAQVSQQVNRKVKVSEAVPNPLYATLRQQLLDMEVRRISAEARRQALLSLLQQTRKQMERFPEDRRKVGELNRRLQVLEQAYINLLSRLQDAQIREAARLGNAVIADIATTPRYPVSPSIPRVLLIALMIGLMSGVGLALVVGMAKALVETPEEAQILLGAPVLASIPKTREDLTQERFLRLMNSRRRIAEAIRSLHANLRFLARKKPFKCLLVTSATGKEGKTFIASSLAFTFAQTGHRVILVDADLRHPNVHHYFNLNTNSGGLAEVLRDELSVGEALQPGPIDNLWILPSGKAPQNPYMLLNSPKMRSLLQNLREMSDIVIIDAPPLSSVADASLIIPLVDGVLFVIAAGQLPRGVVLKAKEQLDLAGGYLIGSVINKVTPKNWRGYYYYDYGETDEV
ncbi:MAG: polysaccharide biosynthesis tyrosine autokinase [Armatimonadetes bacterium]|nr:polysaccharide biosynthesis tyrosine autokinase [Armatimonadota bacterium]